ncbi:hypothetical protein D9615_002898 [Tricholomella constricta]|uniref:UBC core domain-containing protein n=1 Tax=Tricholomella constricta TaxID=117010 RepID=A0A8H5HFX4_9AGAR|nr:hypothetical protein D9615_002898 [Tricholomella constricta]
MDDFATETCTARRVAIILSKRTDPPGAMSQLSRPLLARLHKDLVELVDSPYPGVAVFTDDADIRKLCLVLTPPCGPWKGLSLHFDVELPHNWPAAPPSIRSSVEHIEHPNLFGSYICCDLLKGQDELESGYTGGLDAASTKVEQDTGHTVDIGDYMTNQYATEESLANSMFPGQNCCHASYPCLCSTLEMQQETLEAQWKASTSVELVIATYERAQKRSTTHSVKAVSGNSRLHRFSRINSRWHRTYTFISKWQCTKCPYGSASLPAYHEEREGALDRDGSVPSHLVAPPNCLLGMLNDDVLIELSGHMLSESVIAFSIAYRRFRNLVTSTRVLLQREVRCFFLRTSLRDSVLGIGVAFDPRPRTLSSDFDWLSKQAFDDYYIRTSIQKRKFEYFLPLAFSRPHFERVQKDIWLHLQVLDKAVRDAELGTTQRTGRTTTRRTTPPRQLHHVVDVVYKMMNNIVVSLMKSCDNVLDASPQSGHCQMPTLLHASEKAVISYCHLFHLLLSLARTTPAILQDATNRLRRFVQAPDSRVKAHVPDLGELIVLITLVLARPSVGGAPVTWQVLNGPFLEETITRNVRWVLADLPDLEILESGPSEYRLQKTFAKSRTSLRLVMFQIAFLDAFVTTYAEDVARLDENYGFPEQGIPERMVREVKAIYQVDSWPAFFERVQYARGRAFGTEKMSELLRAAVRTSGQRRYHTPKSPRQLHLLSRDRELLEQQWKKARS